MLTPPLSAYDASVRLTVQPEAFSSARAGVSATLNGFESERIETKEEKSPLVVRVVSRQQPTPNTDERVRTCMERVRVLINELFSTFEMCL